MNAITKIIIENKQKFDLVKSLNLPIGHYAITSSGPLGIRGIRLINDIDLVVDNELWQTLKKKYGEKFWVLSLEVNDEKNKTISDACESLGVNYANKKLLTPEYLWGKETHLNIKGNKVFGEFLYETFIQFYKK